jgi:hypothetical protein
MVLGIILSAIFGGIFGFLAGWVVEIFPNFNASLLDGINLLTGLNISDPHTTRNLFTGLGFILGIVFGILNELRQRKHHP